MSHATVDKEERGKQNPLYGDTTDAEMNTQACCKATSLNTRRVFEKKKQQFLKDAVKLSLYPSFLGKTMGRQPTLKIHNDALNNMRPPAQKLGFFVTPRRCLTACNTMN